MSHNGKCSRDSFPEPLPHKSPRVANKTGVVPEMLAGAAWVTPLRTLSITCKQVISLGTLALLVLANVYRRLHRHDTF
jgi:hypothetical protein